jgi:hypothetical protein
MAAAGICSQIIRYLILTTVSVAMLLVQGVLLCGCYAGARTFAAISRQLQTNARIDEREFE